MEPCGAQLQPYVVGNGIGLHVQVAGNMVR